MDYRNLARQHLKAAEEQLKKEKDQCLKYAALELRMAMEAITYDRAAAYKDEFPPKEYETWQPKKVMNILLEIDPMTDKNSSIAFGLEEQKGVPAPKMTSLGKEIVLNLSTLKKHYDALGSFLHVQTLKNVRLGKTVNYNKLRNRCRDIVNYISEVLSSPVFNCTIGMFSTIECLECKNPIRKRIPHGETSIVAECYECKATYTVLKEEGGKRWEPNTHNVECANKSCNQKFDVWQHELRAGVSWKCPQCKGQNIFVLAIDHKEMPNKASQPTPESGAAEL